METMELIDPLELIDLLELMELTDGDGEEASLSRLYTSSAMLSDASFLLKHDPVHVLSET